MIRSMKQQYHIKNHGGGDAMKLVAVYSIGFCFCFLRVSQIFLCISDFSALYPQKKKPKDVWLFD